MATSTRERRRQGANPVSSAECGLDGLFQIRITQSQVKGGSIMHRKTKAEIAALGNLISETREKAEHFNRALTAKEAALCADAELKIEELRQDLPANDPLTLQNFSGGSSRAIASGGNTGGFENVGDFLQALYRRSKGEGMDARLEPLRVTASTISETVPSSGGFAVPEQFVYKAFAEDLQDTVLLQLCDKIPMTSESLGVPGFADDNHSTSAPFGITWSQIAESASFGDYQALPFKKINLKAHKAGAVFSASNEWLSDADPAMRQRLEDIFRSSLRWYCESRLWNGTGSGQALGALVGDGALSIAKESGQTNDTIMTENIVKMWARLRPGSHSRAIWAANPTTFPQLATLSISIGTGGSVVSLLQPSGIAGGPATSILGRPLHLSEHLPALGNAGDICLLDPLLYLLGDRKQIIVDASPHIRFQYDETAFRAQARFDGQPALSSVLTPANGDTCAWLVKIAAR
jgi:HK97 family phage major capsid protein